MIGRSNLFLMSRKARFPKMQNNDSNKGKKFQHDPDFKDFVKKYNFTDLYTSGFLFF